LKQPLQAVCAPKRCFTSRHMSNMARRARLRRPYTQAETDPLLCIVFLQAHPTGLAWPCKRASDAVLRRPQGRALHKVCKSSSADLAMPLLLAALAAVGAGLAAAKVAYAGVVQSAAKMLSTAAGTACWSGAPPEPASCALHEDTCVNTWLPLPCRAPYRLCLLAVLSCAGKKRSRRPTSVEAGVLAAARRHGIELHEEKGSGVHSKVYRGAAQLLQQVLPVCACKSPHSLCIWALLVMLDSN
jgi:hypothetical protein